MMKPTRVHKAISRELGRVIRVALFSFIAASCSTNAGSITEDLRRFEYTELHMGVQVRIVVYHDDEAAVRSAARDAFSEVARLDLMLSNYKTDSELSTLPARAYPEAAQVSPELFKILELSKELFELSGGLFDVSQGRLYREWREARKNDGIPDVEILDAIKNADGMENVLLDSESKMVLLKRPFMEFDLGAIAKGYANDRLIRHFRRHSIPNVMVDFGGELALGEAPPGKEGWTIQIGEESVIRSNVFISTSGPRYQHVEVDGRVLSHVINPRQGKGLFGVAEITVVHEFGMEADALSTSLSLVSLEKRKEIIEKYSIAEVYER